MTMLDPNPKSSPSPLYRQEDVQQILQLAIARKTEQDDFSHEQLREIAQELDIDDKTLQLAEIDWLKQRQMIKSRQEFDLYRQATLKHKLVRFGIVNGFLIPLNLMGGGLSWSLYIFLLWGMAISLDVWQTFQKQGKAYEDAFEGWLVKKEVKQSITTFWHKFKQFWQS